MATLAEQGRITLQQTHEEIERLCANWQTDHPLSVTPLVQGEWDLFEQCQLETVLQVCRASASLSEAGRRLFSVSRQQKKHPNDADRLRKYLARFQLSWEVAHTPKHGDGGGWIMRFASKQDN